MMPRTRRLVNLFLILSFTLWQTPASAMLPEGSHISQESSGNVPAPGGNFLPGKTKASSLEYVPGELIVKLKEGHDFSELEALKQQFGIAPPQEILPKLPSVQEGLDALKKQRVGLGGKEHPEWYWWTSKDSAEYKEYEARLAKEREVLEARIQAQEELVTRLERRQLRAVKNESHPLDKMYLLKADEKADVPSLVSAYRASPAVQYAEPNYIAKLQFVPNDPFYSSSGSWGQPYADLWGLKKIQCERAWDLSKGEGVIVAVIDSGVDYTHPDLAANIWTNTREIPNNGIDDDGNGYVDDVRGWDFTNFPPQKLPDNDPMDGLGHGTHVAGTIAAVGNNGLGVVGVAPSAKIMPVQGFTPAGVANDADLIKCIVYATDNGADVLNNSWGGYSYSQALVDAFHYAESKGVVAVASAGNDNVDVMLAQPANIDTVIAVAATNEDDQKTYFSNYGEKVVSAPGGGNVNELGGGSNDVRNILSTMSDGSSMATSSPQYKVAPGFYRLAGTSMAGPHVSGVAALVLSKYPTALLDEIKSRTLYTADPYPQSPAVPFGTGRVNAYSALTAPSRPYFVVKDFHLQEIAGDFDQIPDSNEQFRFVVDLKNVWGDASFVSATLTTTSGAISSIPVSYAEFGKMAGGELKKNVGQPFVINMGQIQYDTPASFILTVSADGFTQAIPLTTRLGVRKIARLFFESGLIKSVYHIGLQGTHLVWDDVRYDNTPNIFLYDLATDTERRISNAPPGLPQEGAVVAGNRIVWSGKTATWPNPTNYDIFLYDLATNQVQQLTTDPNWQLTPYIDGDRVVWTDQDPKTFLTKIVLYDLKTGQKMDFLGPARRVTAGPISGNRMVFSDSTGIPGGHSDLYLYNFATGQEQRITNDAVNGVFHESVSIDGTRMVWHYFGGGKFDRDIALYDFQTNQGRALFSLPIDESNPSISGNWVVWEEGGDNLNRGDWNIYAYDLLTNQKTPLTTSGSAQRYPTVNGPRVVWYDRSEEAIYTTNLPNSPSNHLPGLAPLGPYVVSDGNRLTFQVSASDLDGDPLIYSAWNLPRGATFDPATRTFDWTPDSTQAGIYSDVRFAVSDGYSGDSKAVTITVNTRPVANSQSVSLNEDTSKAITLTAVDAEASPLTYLVVAGPAHGILTGSPPNLTYTPAANYNGPDGFTFKANDGLADSNVTTISITVTPVNDAPTADSISPALGSSRQGSLVGFAVTASDVDGTSPTVQGNLSAVEFLLNTTNAIGTLQTPLAYFRYNRLTNGLQIRNNANTGWSAEVKVGTLQTISNNVASLDCGLTMVTTSPNGKSVTVNFKIKPSKLQITTHKSYGRAQDNAGGDSGLVQKGTWTVKK